MPTSTHREERRLQALTHYQVMDSLPEAPFERLARLAAFTFRVPVVLISFFDRDRQWVKAGIGVNPGALDRCDALCNVVLDGGQAFTLADATQDCRFARNPHVLSGLIRFYASVPLRSPDGAAIGTLCLADGVPRPALSGEGLAALEDLADLVMDALEQRLHTLQAQDELHAQATFARELKISLGLSQLLQSGSSTSVTYTAKRGTDTVARASAISANIDNIYRGLGTRFTQLQ